MDTPVIDPHVSATVPAPARRIAVIVILIVLLALCVIIANGPYHLYVNGQRMSSIGVHTAADCAAAVGISLQPGNLLDGRGGLLVAKGGQPGRVLCNGKPVELHSPVDGGDIITAFAGRDKVEPIIETVTRLPGQAVDVHLRGVPLPAALSGFGGLRRVQRGKITGKVAGVQVARVIPVIEHQSNPGASPVVALTFDDGPVPQYTQQILDILASHGARATFFVLGYLARGHPELIQRAARQGHEIGIHSWAHANFTRLSADAMRQDIGRCQELLQPLAAGYAPIRWFRPPYGAKNQTVEAVIQAAGLRLVMWSVDPADWRRPGSDAIYQRVMNQIHDGAVVVMHDGGGPRQGTVEAIRRLVPALQQRGYQLVTMSELVGLEPVFTGQVIITTSDGPLRAYPATDQLQIVLDGEPVELACRPLEAEGQLLIPPEPLVRLLGASYQWDKQRQIVHISGLNGELLLRLNSRQAEKNGHPVSLRVPPILYQDTPMIPLWAIVNITGATARYDSQQSILSLTSPLKPHTYFFPYLRWVDVGDRLSLLPFAADVSLRLSGEKRRHATSDSIQ